MKMNYPICCFLIFAATSFLVANPSTQPQLTFTQGANDTWNADWSGVASRTYFFSWSLDMVTWQYAPFLEFGSGVKSYGLQTQGAAKIFIRLHYVDDAGITSLQQAKDADFDNDGIPNDFEVENLFSNPLDKNSAGGDSNSNELADGWEIFYFGGINIANPSAVLQSDGLTNKEKADLGLNPLTNYSANQATQATSFDYDPVGRLTGVTAPVGSNTFTSDAEGNVLHAP